MKWQSLPCKMYNIENKSRAAPTVAYVATGHVSSRHGSNRVHCHFIKNFRGQLENTLKIKFLEGGLGTVKGLDILSILLSFMVFMYAFVN